MSPLTAILQMDVTNTIRQGQLPSGGARWGVHPWRYVSGYFDAATGMLKFGTRYYMPDLARWTQRDPEWGSPSNPMMLNSYAYAAAGPTNMIDPDGRLPFLVVLAISGVAAFAAGMATHALGGGGYSIGFVSGCAAGMVSGLLTAGVGTVAVLGACLVGGVPTAALSGLTS